jgi:D-ribose pyranose/furanose isomerase RbsD
MFMQQGKIWLIDKSYNLRLLAYENEKKHFAEPKLVEKSIWKLTEHNIKRVIRALDCVPWSTCILS